jgi:hypothetical protein
MWIGNGDSIHGEFTARGTVHSPTSRPSREEKGKLKKKAKKKRRKCPVTKHNSLQQCFATSRTPASPCRTTTRRRCAAPQLPGRPSTSLSGLTDFSVAAGVDSSTPPLALNLDPLSLGRQCRRQCRRQCTFSRRSKLQPHRPPDLSYVPLLSSSLTKKKKKKIRIFFFFSLLFENSSTSS